MELVAYVAEKRTEMHRVLAGNPEEMVLFGRPTPTKDESTETDLKETGWDEMDWIHLAQDRQMAGN